MNAGLLLYPRAQAREVIRAYRDYMASAPDEVGGGVALLTAPPEPFVPEEVRGQPAVGIVFCYVGPPEEGAEAAKAVREFGSPALDMIQPMPYVAVQQMLDAGSPRGVREYFKIDSLPRPLRRGDRHRRRAGREAAGAVRPADPRPDGRGRGPRRR